jgi:hypothetical protein
MQDGLSKSYVEKTITGNELRHAFITSVNLDDKFRRTNSDVSMNLALYQNLMKGNVNFDQQKIDAWLVGDQDLYRDLRATPEVKAKQIKEAQEAQQAEEQAKAQQQGNGQNRATQAIQGGASQAGGQV